MSQRIDLLPLLPGQRRVRPNLADALLAAGLSLVVTLTLLGVDGWQLSRQRAHVHALEQELAGKQRRTEAARIRYASDMGAEEKRLLLEELRADRYQQQELLSRIEALLGARHSGFSAMLAGLAAAHETGTQITRVEILEAGERLRVGGVTRAPEFVTAYADRLGLNQALEGIEFAALDIDMPQRRDGGDATAVPAALAFRIDGRRVADDVSLVADGAILAIEAGKR